METNSPGILLVQCKAYHSQSEIISLIETIIKEECQLQLWVALPLSLVEPISKHFTEKNIVFGTEMMLNNSSDSFTGSIASKMLEALNAKFTFIGSRDEREIYSLNSEILGNKITDVLSKKINPIICFGETFDEHLSGLSKQVLQGQIAEVSPYLKPEQLQETYFLYDNNWIGQIPSESALDQFHKASQIFQETLVEQLGQPQENNLNILYNVPYFSYKLADIISSISAKGYFLGILSPNNQFDFVHFMT